MFYREIDNLFYYRSLLYLKECGVIFLQEDCGLKIEICRVYTLYTNYNIFIL